MRLPAPPVAGQPLSSAWGRQLLSFVASITPREGGDIGVRTTAAGTAYFLKRRPVGGVAAAVHPLQSVDYSDASGAALRFRSGTVNNTIPTVDGSTITVDIDDPANGVLFLGASDKAVVVDAHYTLGAIDAVSLFSQVSETVPANTIDDTGSGDTYRLLARVTVKTPVGSGPWSVTIADDVLGSLSVQLCGGLFAAWGSAG